LDFAFNLLTKFLKQISNNDVPSITLEVIHKEEYTGWLCLLSQKLECGPQVIWKWRGKQSENKELKTPSLK
jgi:hypothetical protein